VALSEQEKRFSMNLRPATLTPARELAPSSFSRAASSGLRLLVLLNLRFAILALLFGLVPANLAAQVSVLTQRNDISRSGVNASETVLTPANVNTTQFGKLFSQTVDGQVYAQPLYMPNVTINGGAHNVVFVVTEHDSVYAFDADNNAGANASPLWQITLLDVAHGAASGATTVPNGDTDSGDISPEIGITSTPVIDPVGGTIYVEGKTKENGAYFHRLHALDITTGAEKFSGPTTITASVSGNGNGSVGGVLNFDPLWELQRPGLLLLNGIVYLGFGSHGDMGPWHGWVLAYNATTLQQTGVFCSTSSGTGSAVWLSGAGLAADVPDPANHPYGRLFVATGNGSFNATTPYTNSMSYGDDVIRFDLTNGVPTVQDSFTPFNQDTLSEDDLDLGAGGVLLLPDQTTGPQHLLIQVGKQGSIYVINRENLGGFNASSDNVVQEVTGQTGGFWSTPTYFNGALYLWATNDDMKAFTFKNGVLGSTHFSSSNEPANFPGPTTVVSANGTTNGIVWAVQSDGAPEILRAYDSTNLNNLLYSSDQNAGRDTPGGEVKFVVPTIANGKVYVPAQAQLSVYGLLGAPPPLAATPTIAPASESFATSVQVTLGDTTPSSSIFYTTNGSTPTSGSTPYSAPFTLTQTTTVKAIATATGFSPSNVASATYTLETAAATPTFSPAPGTYATAQQVTLSDATSGASIFYTTNGSTPTASSTHYTGAITISATTTIKAIATATGSLTSAVATGTYTIETSAATPTFSPAPGTYATAQQVTLSDSTSGASIFYTTNGSTPTASSTHYTGAITIGATTTIKAIATAAGSLTSAVASGTYTIETPAATPTFSPAAGSYATAQHVTLSDTTSGASIFYTTNGSTPTTSSTHYTGAITVSATTTIKAIATATGFATSSVATATYTIETPAATPTFSPAAGTYTSAQHVTLSDATSGASIFYTTNGSAPTTSSTRYTGAITISAATTINAIATAPGSLNSAVATAAYKIEAAAATPTFSPATGAYSSPQHVTITDRTFGSSIFYTTNGSTPTSASTKYTGAITVTATTTIKAIATSSRTASSAIATAAYTIQSAAATPTFSPVAGSYTSAQHVTISDSTAGATIFYTTNGTTPTASSTRYTGAITVSATTTTIKAMAVATGMPDSSVATGVYRISKFGVLSSPR
jgi:Chitobiase/beta-hexosaminidase C-terminal domain